MRQARLYSASVWHFSISGTTQPYAGDIFACALGVHGLPPQRFDR